MREYISFVDFEEFHSGYIAFLAYQEKEQVEQILEGHLRDKKYLTDRLTMVNNFIEACRLILERKKNIK